MKKIISFLGDSKYYKYAKYIYRNESNTTKFALKAICSFMKNEAFDEVIILCTEISSTGFSELQTELGKIGYSNKKIRMVSISDNTNSAEHWDTFERINQQVDDFDELTFDFTHGFRSVPIIMSAALNYILRVKPMVKLNQVYYGVVSFDQNDKKKGETVENPLGGQIVEMRDFYEINEWADGVSRLIDQADTSKLVALGRSENVKAFQNLAAPDLLGSLETLTACLRNIDVTQIDKQVVTALAVLNDHLLHATPSEKQLLQLVLGKFSSLKPIKENNELINYEYFDTQIKIIDMLVRHQLLMQAFTVMRELIGSIGMAGLPTKKLKFDVDSGRKAHRKYAGLFNQIVERGEGFKLKVDENGQLTEKKLSELINDKNIIYSSLIDKGGDVGAFYDILPHYLELKSIGLMDKFHGFAKELSELRNGFDHAWLGKSTEFKNKLLSDVQKKAEGYVENLSEIIGIYCIHFNNNKGGD